MTIHEIFFKKTLFKTCFFKKKNKSTKASHKKPAHMTDLSAISVATEELQYQLVEERSGVGESKTDFARKLSATPDDTQDKKI